MTYYIGDVSGADPASVTVTTGTNSYIGNIYWPSGTGDYWWWHPYIYPWGYSFVPTRHCGSGDHEFMQAKPPHEAILFCRHCGETKQLTKKGNAK